MKRTTIAKKRKKQQTKREGRSLAINSSQQRPSTPSIPSTGTDRVEGIEGVEALTEYEWSMEDGLDQNFRRVGGLLASRVPNLFRHPDGGLIQVEGKLPRRIGSAKELAPLIIDHIRISVTKDGKYHGERIAEANGSVTTPPCRHYNAFRSPRIDSGLFFYVRGLSEPSD